MIPDAVGLLAPLTEVAFVEREAQVPIFGTKSSPEE